MRPHTDEEIIDAIQGTALGIGPKRAAAVLANLRRAGILLPTSAPIQACDHCKAPVTYTDHTPHPRNLCEHHFAQALEHQHNSRHSGPEGG